MGARDERRVDREVGILGRGADQRDQPVLHGGQQRVLLGLVEAVDLVQEEHRPATSAADPIARPRHHRPHLGATGRDGALLLKGGAGSVGDEAGQSRLAAAGRTMQDHRMGMPLLDRPAQRRSRRQHPLLADQLVEGARPHAGGQRSIRSDWILATAHARVVEQLLHARSMAGARRRHRPLRLPACVDVCSSPPWPSVSRPWWLCTFCCCTPTGTTARGCTHSAPG